MKLIAKVCQTFKTHLQRFIFLPFFINFIWDFLLAIGTAETSEQCKRLDNCCRQSGQTSSSTILAPPPKPTSTHGTGGQPSGGNNGIPRSSTRIHHGTHATNLPSLVLMLLCLKKYTIFTWLNTQNWLIN